MAHANKTYINNGGSLGANSLFPNGGAPAPSTGLAISGTVTHDGIVRIISGSDINFGSLGPDFICVFKLENATAGVDLTLTEGTTFEDGYILNSALHYSGSEKLGVVTASGFPYNKALAIGDKGVNNRDQPAVFGQVEAIVNRESSRVFKSMIMQWPAANQANQIANHAGGEQIKMDWDYAGVLGYQGLNGDVNVYTSYFGTTDTGDVMEAFGAVAKSNGVNFTPNSLVPSPAENLLFAYVDSTHQRPNIITYQSFIISESPTNSVWSRVIDTVSGEVANVTRTIAHPVSCTTNFDRSHFPGNCQGMNIPQNKNQLVAGYYKAYGLSAACRVEISDVSSPLVASAASMKKISVCIPRIWQPHLIEIKVIEGLFWGSSLSGNYLHVYNASNTFLGSVQIP